MSRSGRILAVTAAAVLGLVLGYGVMMSLADADLDPVEPIELDPGNSTSPDTTAPTTIPGASDNRAPADTTLPPPTVVPPPTLAPAPQPEETSPPPPPPAGGDDDDDDSGGGGDDVDEDEDDVDDDDGDD
jgi:hypothetical protein